MARWKRGEAVVEGLVAAGDLQKLTGDAANGDRLLEKAATTLETARSAIERDPDSAFVLAYDASRQALTALLAHQGLRPTTKGGHYAVEQPSAPSSDPASASSAPCAGDATSSSTPSVRVTLPRTRRHPRPSRMPPRSSTPLRGYSISSGCSDSALSGLGGARHGTGLRLQGSPSCGRRAWLACPRR